LRRPSPNKGELELFELYAASSDEYLAVCGSAGLGRLAAEGRLDLLPTHRKLASDPRWRLREGVAMGLQRLGEADMGRRSRLPGSRPGSSDK
jgi:hypothetical protein